MADKLLQGCIRFSMTGSCQNGNVFGVKIEVQNGSNVVFMTLESYCELVKALNKGVFPEVLNKPFMFKASYYIASDSVWDRFLYPNGKVFQIKEEEGWYFYTSEVSDHFYEKLMCCVQNKNSITLTAMHLVGAVETL